MGGGFPNCGLLISEIKKDLICLSEGQHLERLSLFRFLFHKQTVCFIICRLLTRSCWLSTSLKYFCLLLCKNWGMISSALACLVRTSGRQRETIGPYIRVASIWQKATSVPVLIVPADNDSALLWTWCWVRLLRVLASTSLPASPP